MTEFTMLQWKADVLADRGLPDVGFPVPVSAFPEILSQGTELSPAQLLFWFQEYYGEEAESSGSTEAAMLALTELLAPDDDTEVLSAEGDNWFLEFGPVNYRNTVIAIQRWGELLALIAPRCDGRLRVAVYRPLDSKALRSLTSLGINPHPESGVAMRENNWEYAKDSSCHTTSALYAAMAGKSHLTFWEFGLGDCGDGKLDDGIVAAAERGPMASALALTQVGVNYEYRQDD
jgi:hypothetical protein